VAALTSRVVEALILASLTVGASACASSRFAATRDGAPPVLEPPPVSVERLARTYSNIYLLRGTSVALVDSGSPGDADALREALAEKGLRPNDVRVVVLTHGHADHAGTARFLQQNGAKVVLGRGDESMTRAGSNDEMSSTGVLGTLLKPFVRFPFDPFVPDVVVDDELELSTYGLPGVRVKRMPGHTRGSVVVLVGRREAITGDLMLGGAFGLPSATRDVGEHYYQHDRRRNHCNVQALLDLGIDRFHLGHGGTVERDAVMRWRRSWDDEVRSPGACD
jgi:hydroxyacylglutathione hydrolase